MRHLLPVLFGLLAILEAGPAGGQADGEAAAAAALARTPIFDGHSDLAIHYLRATPPWSLAAHNIRRSLPGQADLPRWRAGRVGGALVTVASGQDERSSHHFPGLVESLNWFDGLIRNHPDALMRAGTAAELRAARAAGRIALIPAIEGGDQIDGSLANLRTAYRRGVRSMLIVYDHHNAIGDGAMVFEQSRRTARAPNGGLSPFGRQVIAEMNRLGMLVDLSHAAEATALQAIASSRAPVIFSHSGARALSDTPRNLSDTVLRAVVRNDGIVMVPLAPYLVTTAHWRWWTAGEAEYARLGAAHPGDEAAVARGMAAWDAANPEPEVKIGHVADQIDHVARIAGRSRVGIGTDFDGMGRFVIRDLADASRLPALFAELARRGWTRAQLEGLASRNFERVFARAQALAR